jgi:hypothetical protein
MHDVNLRRTGGAKKPSIMRQARQAVEIARFKVWLGRRDGLIRWRREDR